MYLFFKNISCKDLFKEDDCFSMDVVVTGGTGLLGSEFIRSRKNDSISVITRGESRISDGIRYINWSQLDEIKKADIVVNFAGFPIASRKWNPEIKKGIYESRVSATGRIASFIMGLKNPPRLFISGSAIGFYGTSASNEFNEDSGPGAGYLADVAKDWEKKALIAKSACRTVILRTSSVISPSGGFLPGIVQKRIHMVPYFGNGMQWVSWIYISDYVSAMNFIIGDEKIDGPVNMCSPEALHFKDLSRKVAESSGYFTTKIPEKLGEIILGREMFHEIINGQKVIPKKLVQEKFEFRFARIEDALADMKK